MLENFIFDWDFTFAKKFCLCRKSYLCWEILYFLEKFFSSGKLPSSQPGLLQLFFIFAGTFLFLTGRLPSSQIILTQLLDFRNYHFSCIDLCCSEIFARQKFLSKLYQTRIKSQKEILSIELWKCTKSRNEDFNFFNIKIRFKVNHKLCLHVESPKFTF